MTDPSATSCQRRLSAEDWLRIASVVTFAAIVVATPASAEDDERVEEVERQVSVLAEEIDRVRKSFALPFEGPLESEYGLGAAASKIYKRTQGLAIGGYGEVLFTGEVGDEMGGTNEFDALRAVLYFGYKFTDKLLINMELEFEHAGTGGGGSVSTEFLNLDYLHSEQLNFRAGLLLVPMGFINELHEPTFFFGNERPEAEQRIIPTTWRENGLGIFGTLFDQVQYRLYAINGFDGTGFSDNGLRGGRQRGSEALADHWGFVGRFDWTPLDGVLLGASVYTGKSGQNLDIADNVAGAGATVDVPDTLTTIWEVHAQVKMAGASFRGLWTQAHLQDTRALSDALSRQAGTLGSVVVANRMVGGYAEIAYNVLPFVLPNSQMTLEPFYRFEHLDTQDRVTAGPRNRARSRDFHVVGLAWKPHPQVVIKLDYRNIDSDGGELTDEVQAGFGFIF